MTFLQKQAYLSSVYADDTRHGYLVFEIPSEDFRGSPLDGLLYPRAVTGDGYTVYKADFATFKPFEMVFGESDSSSEKKQFVGCRFSITDPGIYYLGELVTDMVVKNTEIGVGVESTPIFTPTMNIYSYSFHPKIKTEVNTNQANLFEVSQDYTALSNFLAGYGLKHVRYHDYSEKCALLDEADYNNLDSPGN